MRPCTALCLVAFALALLSSPGAARAEEAPASPSAPARAADREPAAPDTPTVIPHSLEGRAACSTCHGVAGRKPYPNDHTRRPDVACLSCHVPSQSLRVRAPNTPVPPRVTNTFCLACHEKRDLAMTLPGGDKLSLFIDDDVYSKSMHGKNQMSCTACHPTNQKYPHEPFKGKVARELNRGIIQEHCAKCHADVFAQYRQSVHGKALVEDGNLDVPSCTDCHSVHSIRNPETMLFRLESTDTCTKCHGDEKLMAKYKISPNVIKTYLADFHGTSVRLNRKAGGPDIVSYKAVCYDCHGIHDIKKTGDPTSSVERKKLAETCRRCHPGANDSFPGAWMAHYEPDLKKWPVVYWVNYFYKLAIPGILGGMAFYILLELAHEVVVRFRRWRQS